MAAMARLELEVTKVTGLLRAMARQEANWIASVEPQECFWMSRLA